MAKNKIELYLGPFGLLGCLAHWARLSRPSCFPHHHSAKLIPSNHVLLFQINIEYSILRGSLRPLGSPTEPQNNPNPPNFCSPAQISTVIWANLLQRGTLIGPSALLFLFSGLYYVFAFVFLFLFALYRIFHQFCGTIISLLLYCNICTSRLRVLY